MQLFTVSLDYTTQLVYVTGQAGTDADIWLRVCLVSPPEVKVYATKINTCVIQDLNGLY